MKNYFLVIPLFIALSCAAQKSQDAVKVQLDKPVEKNTEVKIEKGTTDGTSKTGTGINDETPAPVKTEKNAEQPVTTPPKFMSSEKGKPN